MSTIIRQATLDTIDAVTVHMVAVRTTAGRAYDAARDRPVKWGYPIVVPRFEHSRRICR
jgi:hypothetical protein